MAFEECASAAAAKAIPSAAAGGAHVVFAVSQDVNGATMCGFANESVPQCTAGGCMADGGCDVGCLVECDLGWDAGGTALIDGTGRYLGGYDSANDTYMFSYFTLTNISVPNLDGQRLRPVVSGAANFSDLVVSDVYGRRSLMLLFSDNSAVNKTVTTKDFSADPWALSIVSSAIPPTAVGTTLPNVTIEFRGADGGSIQEVEPAGRATFGR